MKLRIITGVILALFMLGVLLFASEPFFTGLTALIVILAAWEWSGLMRLPTLPQRLGYVAIVVLLLLLSNFVSPRGLMLGASFGWIAALILMLLYSYGRVFTAVYWVGFVGIFVLVPFWVGLNVLRTMQSGQYVVLFLVILVAAIDTGGYFVGSFFGRTRIAEKLSPSKSFEGLLGGIVLAFIFSVIYLAIAGVAVWHHWVLILGVVLLISVFSLAGDLFESMFKRMARVKDSSNILPGHGGILDRIDGYTAAVPIFTCLLFTLGYLY